MRRLALVVAVTITAFTVGAVAPVPAAPAADAAAPAAGRVSYRPPVAGPIVDEFRRPPQDWNAGNRGIDYAPPQGTPVKASADGEVTFAGQVGGRLHVVLLHADGIRTTYAFLDSIAVHRGDKVRQGQVVGASGPDGLHFGARVGEEYIDPRTLFDDEPPQVFLVPDEVRRPGTEAEERRGLAAFLRDKASSFGRQVFDFVVDEVKGRITGPLYEWAGLAYYAHRFDPVTNALEFGRTGWAWYRQSRDCTPTDVAPPLLDERRVAVLVAGMGSSSEKGDSLDDLDTARLGYAETVRLSYRGGTIEETDYGQRDTTTDIRVVADHLRDLLADMERRHPGVPIDIIAHSQGGIVAREAMAHGYDKGDRKLPPIRNIVTLASPHEGTDVATALQMVGHTTVGDTMLQAVGASETTSIDPTGDSIAQLSEVSWFLLQLNNARLPEGIRLTSIGSRGDFLVPGVNTHAPGGRNVIVDPEGWDDHSALPGSPEAQREIALAIAGMPPTCQSLGNMLADHAVSNAISWAEDGAGFLAYYGLKRIDKKLEGGDLSRHGPDPDPDPDPPRPPRPSPPPTRP